MKTTDKLPVHFAHNYLINPTNPITVNLIGAGGTGSHMLTGLSKINNYLTRSGHPGISVTFWDDDLITAANTGRQLYADSEVGLYKSVALINRVNRFFGTSWKAITRKFDPSAIDLEQAFATIYISCVDTVQARFDIEQMLHSMKQGNPFNRDRPLYWMDTGNSRFSGQVTLATVSEIKQPSSKRYIPVGKLPPVTEEYRDLLKATPEDNLPSCSLAEAIEKQDLFINPTIADLAGSLLWQLFRNGMTENRGFFINLENLQSVPIKIEAAA